MTEPHNQLSDGSGPVKNTDREIYHTPFNSVHDDSIHVTQGGGIGINVAGNVIVKPLRGWHALASIPTDAQSVGMTTEEATEIVWSLITATNDWIKRPGDKYYAKQYEEARDAVIAAIASQPSPAATVETADQFMADYKRDTLSGMIAAVYGQLDAEDCAVVDREWARQRGYILPTAGTSTLSRLSAATGYDEPQGYAASLRQMARWVREAVDPRTADSQRITLDDIDAEELDAAAAFIARMTAVPQAAPVNAAMAQFVKWAMQEGPWSGAELDGADVQDKARELGLLVKTKYDPELHGESEFDIEPGDDWFVLAPEITSALPRPQSECK